MDRTATDTIDGFNYQFNKSVLEILKADSNTNIILEGYIEDIDIFTNDGITAIQCKYYDSNEKITISTLTKPILDMMVSFLKDDGIKYELYIHYNGVSEESVEEFNLEILNNILKTKNKKYVKKYFPIIYKFESKEIVTIFEKKDLTDEDIDTIHNYLNSTQDEKIKIDKEKFINSIKIISAPSNEELVSKIIQEIVGDGYDEEDALNLFYPNMFQRVAILSANSEIEKRKIICGTFKNEIYSIKTLLTSKWFPQNYDKNKYKKCIKRNLKVRLQNNSSFRVIICDMKIYSVNEIASFINDYLNKYSCKPKLHKNKPLFIIYDEKEDSCMRLQQILYDSYKIIFENGDVGRQFNIKKIFSDNAKNYTKICFVNKEVTQYLLQNKPDDIFSIGNVEIEEYIENGIVCCKIDGLNIDEIREVFYLGG